MIKTFDKYTFIRELKTTKNLAKGRKNSVTQFLEKH